MTAPPQNRPGELHGLAETDEIAALWPAGTFDLENASHTIEENERLLADDKQVIFDLSEATFVDGSIIHALFSLGAEARKNGRAVVVQLGRATMVERVNEFNGIERALPRPNTQPKAQASLRVAPTTERKGAAVNSALTDPPPGGMTIHMAGVDLLPSAVAQLALRLHQAGQVALADYLGRAVDRLRDDIPLREENYTTLLAMMRDECPPILEPLRDRLEFALTHRRHLAALE